MDGRNDHRFDDLLKQVGEFGEESAQGKDALPKLFLRVVQAAADGVIDTEKDKHGDGIDDAARIYRVYADNEGHKAIHQHTKDGLKANVSKLRCGVRLGLMTSVDGVVVIDRAVTIRGNQEAASNKCKSAYPAYVDVAREQLKQDTELTDDQIKEVVLKPEPAEKDVVVELKAIEKKLERIITGEGGVKDQSQEVIDAHALIRTRLAALVTKAERDKKLAMYSELAAELATELREPAEQQEAA
jgi:hypothetical protein